MSRFTGGHGWPGRMAATTCELHERIPLWYNRLVIAMKFFACPCYAVGIQSTNSFEEREFQHFSIEEEHLHFLILVLVTQLLQYLVIGYSYPVAV